MADEGALRVRRSGGGEGYNLVSKPIGLLDISTENAVLYPKSMDNLLERITMNPAVLFGKPTIRNKRYPVTLVLDLLAAGMSAEDILADYEDLEQADILACLLFASRLAEVKSIQRLPLES